MKKPFDIFWFGESGPNWIEAVDTLEVAQARMKKLPQARIEKLPQGQSGSYAVLDKRAGNRLSFAPKLQGSSEELAKIASYERRPHSGRERYRGMPQVRIAKYSAVRHQLGGNFSPIIACAHCRNPWIEFLPGE
jgi:hypothetical protein